MRFSLAYNYLFILIWVAIMLSNRRHIQKDLWLYYMSFGNVQRRACDVIAYITPYDFLRYRWFQGYRYIILRSWCFLLYNSALMEPWVFQLIAYLFVFIFRLVLPHWLSYYSSSVPQCFLLQYYTGHSLLASLVLALSFLSSLLLIAMLISILVIASQKDA